MSKKNKDDYQDNDISFLDGIEDEPEEEEDLGLKDDLLDDDVGAYGDFFEGGGELPMEKHKDLLKDLTDFSEELKDKVHFWMGKTWDPQQKVYVKDEEIDPIMNYKGALWCISFLKNYSKKTNILTYIDEAGYKYIREDIVDVLWEEFAPICEIYGVKSNSDLKRICIELEHAALFVLMGAGGGKYSKVITQATHRNENVNYTESLRPGMQGNSRGGLFKDLKTKFIGRN